MEELRRIVVREGGQNGGVRKRGRLAQHKATRDLLCVAILAACAISDANGGPELIAARDDSSAAAAISTLSLAEQGHTDRVIVVWKGEAAKLAGAAAKTTAIPSTVPGGKRPPEGLAHARLGTDRRVQEWDAERARRLRVLEAGSARISERIATALTLTPHRRMADGAEVLRLPARVSPQSIARLKAELLADNEIGPQIEDVIPDRVYFPQLAVNDPRYVSGEQWALNGSLGIGAPGAWDISTGNPNLVVAVIDTGKLNHADLAGRWIGGYDFVSLAERSNDGESRDADATDAGDWVTAAESLSGPLAGCPVTNSRWHGTAMAGIIAATGNNGQGIAGVNWGSRILPVRAVGKCGGYESDIADAMRWAAGLPVPGVPDNPHPARVLNMSLAALGLGAGQVCSSTLQSAVDAVLATNTPIIVAAGNSSNATQASTYSPGNCNGVITIGATDKFGGLPTYANTGSPIALSAPGGSSASDPGLGILTTGDTGATTAANDNAYVVVQGTSAAAAHVTGMVSLMLGANPALSPTDIRDILVGTITPFPPNAAVNGAANNCAPGLCGAGIAALNRALPLAALWGNAAPQVAASFGASYALRSDGTVFSWGYGLLGQLGNGGLDSSNLPAPIAGLRGITRISANQNGVHGMALRADGIVFSWGSNPNGVLGDGTQVTRLTPVQSIGIANAINISAGSSHSMALKADGTVMAWGANTAGQIGDGSVSTRLQAVAVGGLSGVSAIAAGDGFSIALRNDGTVWAWGAGSFGQLGNGIADTMPHPIPAMVPGLTSVVAIAAGENSAYAIKADGTVWAWGGNFSGQIGDGTTAYRYVPVQVFGLSAPVELAASMSTLARLASGAVWAWGDNSAGQLGDGTRVRHTSPSPVAGLGNVTSIALGNGHSLAVLADGSLRAWGDTGLGQLGVGVITAAQPTPVVVQNSSGTAALNLLASNTSFVGVQGARNGSTQESNPVRLDGFAPGSAISIVGGKYAVNGNAFGVAAGVINPGQSVIVRVTASSVCNTPVTATLTVDGNSYGFTVRTAVCDASPDDIVFPTVANVPPGSTQTSNSVTVTGINQPTNVSISGGSYSIGCLGAFTSAAGSILEGQSICARLVAPASGNVVATAQMQIGTRSVPFSVMTRPPATFVAPPGIVTTRDSTAALGSDGNVLAFGGNYEGQLGMGIAQQTSNPLPVAVSGLSGIVSLAAGWYHLLARHADGSVWSWGSNNAGQLGSPGFENHHLPERIAGLTSVVGIGAGGEFSFAVKADGSLWAWGANSAGQLGDGTTIDRQVPAMVTGISGVTSATGGYEHALALKADGTVWSWGMNTEGQLGNGSYDAITRPTPALVDGLSGVVGMASSSYFSLAVRGDGTVWAWGNGSSGQLGNGTAQSSAVPIQVAGLTGAIAVAAGWAHSLALKSDGTVWSWGYNTSGQLGLGTPDNTAHALPAIVPGINNAIAIGANHDQSFAILANGMVLAWGADDFGLLGQGVNANRATPGQVLNPAGSAPLLLNAGGVSFAAVINAQLGSVQTSNTVVISGVAAGSALSISGGQYSLDDGPYTSANGTVNPGQSVTIRLTSASTCATKTIATLTIAGIARPYEVTTVACDETPDNVYFNSQADVATGTVVTSNPVVVSGINTTVSVTISGGSYAIGCGAVFATAPGAIANGQSICVRQTSAATENTVSTIHLTIGTKTIPFSVTTGTSSPFAASPMIAAGESFAAVLRSDGHVWTWGSLYSYVVPGIGQLRIGSAVPAKVAGLSAITRIAAGTGHMLALRSDGTVWTWGSNYYGELGDGTTTARASPSPVPSLSSVVAIAGGEHSLALRSDGTVMAWGQNQSGQLGDGTTVDKLSPVAVIGMSGVTALAAGLWTSYVLKNDGTVWRLGVSHTQIGGMSNIVAIASGDIHLLALRNDGVVLAYGSNGYGQLGDGTLNDRYLSAVQVSGLGSVVAIAANEHSMALKADGTVWSWGRNISGKLGVGTLDQHSLPVPLATPDNGMTAIAAGFYNGYALRNDGTVYAWGGNDSAELGLGVYDLDAHVLPSLVPSPTDEDDLFHVTGIGSRPYPVQFAPAFGVPSSAFSTASPVVIQGLAAGLSIPVSVSGGLYSINGGAFGSTPGMVRNGDVVVVGADASVSPNVTTATTLTIGTTYGRSATFYVRTRSLGGVASVIPQTRLGESHSYTLTSKGTAFGFGYNGNGQLGNGTTLGTASPVPVAGLGNLREIVSGANHGLALKDDGGVVAWGYNAAGQLGTGSSENSLRYPTPVSGLAGVVSIAAGDYHSLALKQDGTVWAWGLNVDGQLGDGSIATLRNTPVQVSGLSGVIAISAGGRHSLAVRIDGSVVAWGLNTAGQLGNNGTVSSNVPVGVPGLGGIVAVAAGGKHSLALKGDATLVAWGDNAFGQLGLGDTNVRLSPVAVPGLTQIGRLSAGAGHSLALKAGGQLYTWGNNGNNQLGDASNTNKSSPYLVPGVSNVVAIGGGGRHSAAMRADGKVYLFGDNFFGQLGNASGNFNPHSAALNVLRGDSQISGFGGAATSSTGSTSTSGSAVIDIAGLATDFDFGDHIQGSTITIDGTFRNQALADSITGIGLNVVNTGGTAFTLQSSTCGPSLAAGGECGFTVAFNPNSSGDQSGRLEVASSLVGSPELRQLFGKGIAPSSPGLKLTTTGGLNYFQFEPQTVGTASAGKAVSLANPGNATLIVSSVSLTAGQNDFSLTNPAACASIPAGMTCDLNLQFNPIAPNNPNLRPGQLTIATNAGTQTVALEGAAAPSDAVASGLALIGAQSMKNHGTHQAPNLRGLFIDRSKSVADAVTVEPRAIGSGHLVVFQFNGTITHPGTASLTDRDGQPVAGAQVATQASGNDVIVTIANLPDASRVTISLTNVNGTAAANSSLAIGFLVGDVNGSGKVTGADIAGAKARTGQTVDASNFKYDVNQSGTVNSTDVTVVKSRAGNQLP